MNFAEAYNYLLSFQNLPRKEYMNDPRHCQIYLKRLQFFLNILGNPEKKIPHYIHITGTSGKGSVVSFLHSILHSAGKKVGSTQSPHPTTILERWKVGDHDMTEDEFVKLIKFVKPKLDEYTKKSPYDMLSFFELIEAIGFVYFANKKVEWLVLETGCGGRYDSTNVIPYKDVAVITNVGLDHVGIIGNNREEIAYEKAGIIKKGCQAFTMEKNKKILDIFEKEAKRNKVTLHQISDNKYQITKSDLTGTSFIYKNLEYNLKNIGDHQTRNAILSIEVSIALNIPLPTIKRGLKKTVQPLRMEIISNNPLVILDGAHNQDKIKTTIETIQLINSSTYKQIHLIVGFSGNKDIKKMIKLLAKLEPESIACTRNTVNHFRKVASPQDIAKLFRKNLSKNKIEIFLDPEDALTWSRKQAKKSNSLILVTGSIFLSGQLSKTIKN